MIYLNFLRALADNIDDPHMRIKVAKQTGFDIATLKFLFSCELNFLLQEAKKERAKASPEIRTRSSS